MENSSPAGQPVQTGRAKKTVGTPFHRHFTASPQEIKFAVRDSLISEPDGKRVFELRGVEVPAEWTQ